MAHFVFYDLPQDVRDKITDLRAEMAANRFLLWGHRLSALVGKANFNPSQPRVPEGDPRGGEWTYVPGWTKPRTGDDAMLRPQRVNASSATATARTASETPPAAMRVFEAARDGLVESRTLTQTESRRFTFDPRYAAFKYFKNRFGGDEVVPASGQFFPTTEERDAYVRRAERQNRDPRYHYTAAFGYTDARWPLFGSPASVIYGSAAEQGSVAGIIQDFPPLLMMRFTIMHEYAHQIGIRSEDAAIAYAARRLRIRNTPPARP